MADDELPWRRDYAGYMLLLISSPIMLALRLTGTVDWAWWVIVAPLVAIVLMRVGTHVLLRINYRRDHL